MSVADCDWRSSRSTSNVSDSDSAGGRASGSVLRIDRGSDSSTSCSRSVSPRAASIFSRSSACGPM